MPLSEAAVTGPLGLRVLNDAKAKTPLCQFLLVFSQRALLLRKRVAVIPQVICLPADGIDLVSPSLK